ncbi:tripartite motif-containing protein 6 isoform X2 [Puntigrus tetrazona]|uniref:tripartite motif-containing protein 6 isoform X2 n=1 Tax=Puntigrus tetrazona TaxID=1606681 RepID=UPI001C89FAE3|nr:tripartite motif-containing protein 6 isoform X2 [Puntigrus tetrazona]
MAEAILGDQDQYSCSICLDLLKDPVTIPCGHSYCMSCINECWSTNDQEGIYRCPQCRQTFDSKPPLNRSTVLAEIMEKLGSTGLSESAQCLAGPGEIACDFCSGERIKAVKSCLECRASYCEIHVQPHYNVPALKKHKLVKAAVIPVCPKHDKLLEVYCRTDHKCVCMHCLLDDHKGHDTVPSTTERNEKQTKLTQSQTKVKQTVQAKEQELQMMKIDIASHSDSAKKAVENSKKMFSELVKLIEKKSNEVIEEIKAQEKADLDQGTKLQKKLEEDITELKKRDRVLDDLLQADDIQFLQNYESVSSSSGPDGFQKHSFKPCCSYPDINKRVCELKERLEAILNLKINETFQKDLSIKDHPDCIKVGDKVRVKPSIKTPKFDWGTVTHKSVGVVKDIKSDQSLIIDFPESTSWKGLLSEMEPVPDDNECGSSTLNCNIKKGDKVRVKPSVETPKYLWGSVSHGSIGSVINVQGEAVTVDFPEQQGWIGEVSEMELVPALGSQTHARLKIGNRVSVKSSVKDPIHGWGSITHDSIGVIKRIQGESLTVDFPEQTDWTGVVSEMVLIQSDVSEVLILRSGARVRVKPTISTPAHGWGSVTKKSIGVVVAINGIKVTVNFPEQSGWTGIVSEMEVVP